MSTPVEITWLLAAVTKGDPVAFERLYGATCAELYGVVLRIVRREDLAADVMEDAYLQIWGSAGEFDPAQSAPLAWMVAIARRLAIDVARRPLPLTSDGEPEVIDDNEGPGTVPRHQLTDDLKRLLTCIGRLELTLAEQVPDRATLKEKNEFSMNFGYCVRLSVAGVWGESCARADAAVHTRTAAITARAMCMCGHILTRHPASAIGLFSMLPPWSSS